MVSRETSPCLFVSGWGDTGGSQATSTDKLQESVVTIVESSICVERMNQAEDVDGNLILCSASEETGPCKVSYVCHVSCFIFDIQGDSGGPLTTVNDDGAHTLVGIVSKRLSQTCSQGGFSVFTNVASFLPWIETMIKENGGMASCSFNVSAPPTPGNWTIKVNQKEARQACLCQEHPWSKLLRLVFWF